jgi:nucleoid DNA-binding protein
MNEKLNIQDLAARLAEKSGITKKEAESFLREFSDTLHEALFSDQLVKVKNLGGFKLTAVSDRESIDVVTGQRVLIPAHYKISFSPENSLSDAVNEPFSLFETIEVSDEEAKNLQADQLPETSVKPDNPVLQPPTPIVIEQEAEEEPQALEVIKEPEIIESLILEPVILEPIQSEPEPEPEKIEKPESQPITETSIEESPEIDNESPHYNIPNSDYDFPYSDYNPVEQTFFSKLIHQFGIWNIIFTALFCLIALGLAYLWWTDNYAHRIVHHEPASNEKTETPVEVKKHPKVTDIPRDTLPEILPAKSLLPATTIHETVTKIDSIAKPVKNKAVYTEPIKDKTAHVTPPRSGNMRTVEKGETLRLIALKEFGDKAFWIYIYEVNKQRIANPNNVSVGAVLALPSVEQYGIDAGDPESIRKANLRAEQIK